MTFWQTARQFGGGGARARGTIRDCSEMKVQGWSRRGSPRLRQRHVPQNHAPAMVGWSNNRVDNAGDSVQRHNARRIRGSTLRAQAATHGVPERSAALLDKLHVGEFTKSRPRRSTITPWSRARTPVVRRQLGHEHIPTRFVDDVERFI